MSVSVSEKKTNIIYVVLDDMGYSDLGCFGAEVETPNIDALACNGLLYSNSSVCPASSPTRASLLTGRNNGAVGMGSLANAVSGPSQPENKGRIIDEAGTIAEILKENGYSTLAVGKWHCAPLYQEAPCGPFDYWPLGKGFQRFYGFLEGETDQFHPQLVYDNHMIDAPDYEGYHLSQDLVDRSMEFVSDTLSLFPDKPFFLYLCFGVAHSPHQVPRPYIDYYKGKYDRGWDVIREERFNRQMELGILPEGTVCSERDPMVQIWDELDEDRKRLYCLFQETYAGFITHCDEQIGRLVEFLKEVGEYDNSIIVLISDNGATRDGGVEGKDDMMRGFNGITPLIDDLFAEMDDIGGPKVKALYPKGWASVSNTPFPEYKGSNYGGGVRTPMVVHWSDGINDPGIRFQMVNVEDITPTVLDILGIKPPEIIKGVRQMPMHGTSFYHTFKDAGVPSSRNVKFYRWNNSRGIVTEDWKAVSVHTPGTPFESDRWDLFHIARDYAEAVNVAEQYPEKLEEMKALWEEEAPKYIQLPMRELSIADMMSYTPDDSPTKAKHFRLLPKLGRLGCTVLPRFPGISHSITVPIFRESTKDEGMLFASGGYMGGFTLFVMNNRAVYEFNNFKHYSTIISDCELPAGDCTIRLEFRVKGNAPGPGGGPAAELTPSHGSKVAKSKAHSDGPGPGFSDFSVKGTLFVDGKEAGKTDIITSYGGQTLEGVDIGRDSMTPVSPKYYDRGTFPFTGTIKEVIIDID